MGHDMTWIKPGTCTSLPILRGTYVLVSPTGTTYPTGVHIHQSSRLIRQAVEEERDIVVRWAHRTSLAYRQSKAMDGDDGPRRRTRRRSESQRHDPLGLHKECWGLHKLHATRLLCEVSAFCWNVFVNSLCMFVMLIPIGPIVGILLGRYLDP